MPQSPLLVDAIQIEPGTSTFGTRVINRNTTDGSLQFADPNFTGTLQDLVGVKNITDMLVVGAGEGASYSTVQSAIDAVPNNATADAPVLIAIYNGLYQEDLVIEKDGIHLVGMGGAVLRNSASGATLTIQEGGTVPLRTVIQNLRIENTSDGEECIRADGQDTYASGTVTVNTAALVAGDSITIGGTALTAVTGSRTSGSDNFSVDGATTDAVATEISAAINDVANSFAATVSAFAVGAVVTITAVASGVGGNSITIAVATTPAGGLTASGATLTGGGDPPTLLSDGLYVIGCDLVATGVGTRQIVSATVNNVFVRGGSFRGSSSTSSCVVTQTGNFRLFGVEWTNNFEMYYDTASTEPSDGAGGYEISGCGRCNNFLINLVDAGDMKIKGCPEVGTVAQDGAQSLLISQSSITTLELNSTTSATLWNTRRTTASITAGTPTLAETQFSDSVVFTASASETVTFDIPQPDAAYFVFVDSPTLGSIPQVTSRTAAGFTIETAGAFTGTVNYLVVRQA